MSYVGRSRDVCTRHKRAVDMGDMSRKMISLQAKGDEVTQWITAVTQTQQQVAQKDGAQALGDNSKPSQGV